MNKNDHLRVLHTGNRPDEEVQPPFSHSAWLTSDIYSHHTSEFRLASACSFPSSKFLTQFKETAPALRADPPSKMNNTAQMLVAASSLPDSFH